MSNTNPIVLKALEIKRKDGVFEAALLLRLFKYDVEEAVQILARRAG